MNRHKLPAPLQHSFPFPETRRSLWGAIAHDLHKCCNGIRKVQEYEATHGGIEGSGQYDATDVALNKLNVSKVSSAGTFSRLLQGAAVHVNANYLSVFADEIGHQEGYVANATADIQNLHSRRYPGLFEEPLRQRSKEIGLLRQPRMFIIRSAKRISWIRHDFPRLRQVHILPSCACACISTLDSLYTELYGSVYECQPRCLVRRPLGRHSTRRTGAARACRGFNHRARREIQHDPHGHEEARRRPGAGRARHHARRSVACGPARSARIDWRKRRHGSRSTASSGPHASTSWTGLSRI